VDVVAARRQELGETVRRLAHQVGDIVQLRPERLLDLGEVGPGIHAVCLDVLQFLLSCLLLDIGAFDLLYIVGFLGRLDDNVGDLLRRLDLLDDLVLLEALCDDLADRHVIDFF
jgi:hypothetical protein